jgi:hypothetical protein
MLKSAFRTIVGPSRNPSLPRASLVSWTPAATEAAQEHELHARTREGFAVGRGSRIARVERGTQWRIPGGAIGDPLCVLVVPVALPEDSGCSGERELDINRKDRTDSSSRDRKCKCSIAAS